MGRGVFDNIPDASSPTPDGPFNVADVATPLSPVLLLVVPVPPNVEMMPVDTVTLRIRLLFMSPMYRLPWIRVLWLVQSNLKNNEKIPDESSATPTG